MGIVGDTKGIVDRIYDSIPDPSGGTVKKRKYNIKYDETVKGQYYVTVFPHGVESNPASNVSSEAVYSVSIYLVYFADSSDDLTVANETFLAWADSVFDTYHLESLSGYAQYIQCDFVMSPTELSDLRQHALNGEIQCNIRKRNVK